MNPDQPPRADAKLKNLPDEAQEALWEYLHPADPEERRRTLAEAQSEVPLRHGFTVSLGSLSEWRSWYALRRRMNAARERADQTRIELLKDASLRPDEIEKVAQAVFTAETLEAGNVKGYVALAQLRLKARQLDHDARKLALLEAAAAEAKEKLLALTATAKTKGGLTPETLAEIEAAAGLL
jgi:hypothetical protein